MKDELYARFENAVNELDLDGSPILLALSGGSDSVAMLRLFCRFREKSGVTLYALHVHHGLRAKEADRDEEFARSLCEKCGVGYSSVFCDVKNYAQREKKSIEESARILRYAALKEESAKRGNAYVATAHNADDQLETLIFRLIRGSGTAGMSGIPKKRGRIIRPMLSFTKREIEGYLEKIGQPFVFDSTNAERECARNKIRLDVLPVLREICPAAAKNAGRLAENSAEDENYLLSLLPEGTMSAEDLQKLPLPLLKREIVSEYRRASAGLKAEGTPEDVHIEALAKLVKQKKYGASLSFPGTLKATFDRGGLHFSSDRTPENEYEITLAEGENRIPGENISIYVMTGRRFSDFSEKCEKIHNLLRKATLDSATIKDGLYMRPKKAGDKLVCGKMTHAVSKLIAESTDDTLFRRNFPVICDKNGVVWVPGHPPKDGCAAEEDNDLLKIYLIMGESSHGTS